MQTKSFVIFKSVGKCTQYGAKITWFLSTDQAQYACLEQFIEIDL